MKKILLVAMMAAALAVAPKAEAALMTGGISIAGFNTAVLGVDAAGTVTSLGSATGLDFTTTGVATPGVPGNWNTSLVNQSGSFTVIGNTTAGEINDFMFAAPGVAGYPGVTVTGLQTLVGAFGTFSFDLVSVWVVNQNDSSLTLNGTGLFHLTGFDDTEGTFVLTVNQAGQTLSFSASEAAVPEPGSMLLLGTGLLGLAALARRRMRKA